MLLLPPPLLFPVVRPFQLALGFTLGWIARGRSQTEENRQAEDGEKLRPPSGGQQGTGAAPWQ